MPRCNILGPERSDEPLRCDLKRANKSCCDLVEIVLAHHYARETSLTLNADNEEARSDGNELESHCPLITLVQLKIQSLVPLNFNGPLLDQFDIRLLVSLHHPGFYGLQKVLHVGFLINFA